MNNTHLHLVVNHLPIIFPMVGIIVLLIGIFTKSETSKRNSYIIFILGAIATIAAMATGEGAEEGVEHIQGVSENLIHPHEEVAEIFSSISYLLGAISLVALILNLKKKSIGKFSPFVVLALSAITLIFAVQTGSTGGKIRHTELQNGNSENGNDSKNDEDKEDSENKDSFKKDENVQTKNLNQNSEKKKDKDDDDHEKEEHHKNKD